MTTYRRPLILAAIALASSALVVSTTYSSQAATPTATNSASTSKNHAATNTSKVNQARRAIRAARKAVRHGQPYDLERDRYRGRVVWEVDVASGSGRPYEILTSSNGRRIVRKHRSDDRGGDDARRVKRAKVGFSRALRIASRHGSGALSEAEIDRHRGKIVWTVEFERFRAETEVAINARTAKVVYVRHGVDRD